MLILDLIYSSIETNEPTALFQVKDEFLLPKELPYLHFVQKFFAQHTKLPDVQTVEQKFNISIPINNEPAEYWRKEIVGKYQESVIENGIRDAAKNKGKAIDIWQQSILDHNVEFDSKVITHNALRKRDRYALTKKTGGIFQSTGNVDYDLFSLGYKPVDLWTIGGTEGSGKTWILCRMACWLDWALLELGINNRTILFISGEMDAEEVEDRMDCIRTGLPYNSFIRGELTAPQELKYNRYLDTNETNIKVVDTFDGLKDIEYLMVIYKPVAVMIDNSHLMAKSYDWGDIAQVTSGMKRAARNKKTPIINTTHLKASMGQSGKGGSIDDFAYTKGYTRDSDIAGVIFKNDMMELESKFGIDWVKVRRGVRTRQVFEQDFKTMDIKLVESLAGPLLAATKVQNMLPGILDPDDDQIGLFT